MAKSGKSNDIRNARRIKATLAAKSSAEFDRFLAKLERTPIDTASAYVASQALRRTTAPGW